MAKSCLKNEEETVPFVEEGCLATEETAEVESAPGGGNTSVEVTLQEAKVEDEAAVVEDSLDDGAALAFLQKLETDEARLSEQKEQLSSLLEQLQAKVRQEIENKKRRVQRLNSEVKRLKTKCEKFAALVNGGMLQK